MRRHGAIWGALTLVGVTIASPGLADPPKPAWQTVRVEDGIIVSKKDVPGSSLLAFRGEGDVDAPILAVGSVILDDSQATEWVDSVVAVKVLRQIGELEQVTYTHIATPFIMADRESVTREKVTVDPVKKSVLMTVVSVDDPLAPKTNRVRVRLDDSSFSLTSIDGGNKTHVIAEIHADPGGNVPGFVVNSFQKNWGFNTLKSLRKQVKKSKAVNATLRARLEAAPTP